MIAGIQTLLSPLATLRLKLTLFVIRRPCHLYCIFSHRKLSPEPCRLSSTESPLRSL